MAQKVLGIRVRLQVGSSLMAASDDPLFLGLRGRCGREFRLLLAHGRSLRRGQEDVYILGAPGGEKSNVAHPEFNDPASSTIDAASITGAYLRKGLEPIPNVRAMGEMDDRLELLEAEVAIDAEGRPGTLVFARFEPIWLGLICGLSVEIPAAETA